MAELHLSCFDRLCDGCREYVAEIEVAEQRDEAAALLKQAAEQIRQMHAVIACELEPAPNQPLTPAAQEIVMLIDASFAMLSEIDAHLEGTHLDMQADEAATRQAEEAKDAADVQRQGTG